MKTRKWGQKIIKEKRSYKMAETNKKEATCSKHDGNYEHSYFDQQQILNIKWLKTKLHIQQQ